MTIGLELQGIECVRGARSLCRDLDLSLPRGCLLHVRGANGAGKTSLLRLIVGLLEPAAGSVRWGGTPVAANRDDFHRQLVYIGHAAALKDDLTPLENLRLAATLGGHPCSEAEAAAALTEAGLRRRERVPSRILSQGQRRRVSLARLVLSRALPLWVLDEPFNALDRAATAWLQGLIGQHVSAGGVVVLTSHQEVTFDAAVPQRELLL
jgi:heme exporter protein A